MTFKAVVSASLLEKFLGPVSVLVDEVKLHCNEDGFEITAVDPANVAMVNAELPMRAFESYEADGGTLGVDLGRLEDVVGMAGSGDLIWMELNEETRKLEIQVDNLEYTLALIDPDSIRQEPDLPDGLEMCGEAVLEGKQFNRALTAADLASDHIGFEVHNDAREFVIDAEGDTDDVEYRLDEDDLLEEPQFDADGYSLFSLDYLKDMNKAIDTSAEVALEIGDELPINIRYQRGDEDEIDVRYMLAPRIQSD